MTNLDLTTRAWLDEMVFWSGGNVFGPDQLKAELSVAPEWRDGFRRIFEHVLSQKTLTAKDYARKTDINFKSDQVLFEYLERLYDFLFNDDEYPEFPN